jgi:hypothetical protein
MWTRALTSGTVLLQVGPFSFPFLTHRSQIESVLHFGQHRRNTVRPLAASISVFPAASSTPCCRPGHRCWRADLWRAQLAAATSRLQLRCARIQISAVALAHVVGRVTRHWQLDLRSGLPFLLHMRPMDRTELVSAMRQQLRRWRLDLRRGFPFLRRGACGRQGRAELASDLRQQLRRWQADLQRAVVLRRWGRSPTLTRRSASTGEKS